jgi:hypothetical protein
MTRRDPIDLTIRSLLQPRCLINFFCTNPMRVHIIAGPDSRMECNRVPSEFLSVRRSYGRSHARREAIGTFVSQ